MSFKHIISVSFVLCLLSFTSPNHLLPDEEQVLIQFDKGFYVTGEVIWYKVHLPQSFKSQSKTLKISIADSKGNVLQTNFLKTFGETYLQGYYKIPYALPSGLYQLVLTGTDLNNFSTIKLLQTIVPIYNDLAALSSEDLAHKGNVGLVPDDITKSSLYTIHVKTGNSVYQKREQVMGSIQVTDKRGAPVPGNVSVVVLDKRLSSTYNEPVLKMGIPVETGKLSALSDDILFKGKLFNRSDNPIKANVLGAYSVGENQIYFTKSTEDGTFYLTLPDFAGEKEIQFISFQNEHESIKANLIRESVGKAQGTLQYDDHLIKYLELSQLRKKIFQHYHVLEGQLSMEEITRNKIVLEPDKTYIVDEYEHFENMASFFKEILTPLRFRKSGDQYEAYMYNPASNVTANKYFRGDPLFIIDGKTTRNANFIANLEMEKVESVELFFNPQNLRRQFNVFGNSGVVRIVTNVADLIIPEDDLQNVFKIAGLLPSAKFEKTQNSNLENGDKMPIFKPRIYWNPSISLDQRGNAEFSFTHSDDLGEFIIQVVFLSDNGIISSSQSNYRVE